MRGFFFTRRTLVGASAALLLILSLPFWLRANQAQAGIEWGIPERNELLTTNGSINARAGDTVRFRFYWYDPDVALGPNAPHPDKVKLHVCKDFSGLADTLNGGRCYNELIGSDWLSTLPTPYTELSYQLTGNEAAPCDVQSSPQCSFSFTFWVCDAGAGDPSKAECRNEKGAADNNPATLGGGTINILGNHPPTATSDTKTLPEDTPTAITLGGSDPDGDPITFQANNPAHGTLDTSNIANRVVTYTPNPNYNGPDSFTFTTRDHALTSNPGTISITVTPVNDPPVLTSYFVNKTTGETFNPSTVKSVTAGATVSFEVGWIEIENQPVKVHVCATNALQPGSEASGGTCVTSLAESTSFSPTSPVTVSYTTAIADGGKDQPFYVFVCDNDATNPKCSPAQFNSGTFHINVAYPLTVSVTGLGTVTSDSGGITCPTTCTEPYLDRTIVQLTAAPSNGFAFDSWSGDCTSDPCVVTMTQARNIHATFKPTHTLSVTISGGGEVKSDIGGIDCRTGNTGTCSASIIDGKTVVLSPTPDPGQTFTGWSLASCGGFGSCNATVTNNLAITATFKPSQQLTITKDPGWTGLGSVKVDVVSSPPGGPSGSFTCSSFPCTANPSYLQGTVVKLTATPSATANLGTWSNGGCSGSESTPCQVTLNTDTTVQAQFKANYTLNITIAGSGSVTMNPAGTNCGANCGIYLEKTAVALTATQNNGYIFVGWSGDADCTDGNVTMNTNHSCTATFATAVNLVLKFSGTGSGNVVSTAITPPVGQPPPPPINCSSTCTIPLLQGTSVDLKESATGTPTSNFINWSGGGCSGNTNTCTGVVVTGPADTVITLNYQAEHTLTITKVGNGTVTMTPSNASCGTTCSLPFSDTTSVTLTAANDPGYVFTDWTSSDPGFSCPGSGSCTVSMDRDRTVKATFRKSWTLTFTKIGSGAVNGTVATGTITAPNNGPTTSFSCGATCSMSYLDGTVIAVNHSESNQSGPPPAFIAWSQGCNGSGACSVTLSADTTVTANFQAQFVLNVTVQGPGNVTNGALVDCPRTPAKCNVPFPDTASPNLTATPSGGAGFLGWQGDCSGQTCAPSMTQTRNVTAIFGNKPAVNVGAADTPPVGQAVNHSGASATDTDNNIVSYQWISNTCPGGGCNGVGPVAVAPTGNLTIPGPSFTPTVAGVYQWTLSVTDSTGLTTTAQLNDQTATPPTTEFTGCPPVVDASGNPPNAVVGATGMNPATPCASGGGPQYISRDPAPDFSFYASDPETPAGPFTWKCTLVNITDNTTTNPVCNSSVLQNLPVAVGKTYRLEVQAIDNTNKIDPNPAKFTWQVQPNTPPVVTLTNQSIGYNSFQGANAASFTFSAVDTPPDNPLTFYCEYDGVLQQSPPSHCAKVNSGASVPWSLTNVSAGHHTARIEAVDSLGASAWSSTFSWDVPTVTITGGPTAQTVDSVNVFSFSGQDNDSPSLSFQCQIGPSALADPNSWQSCATGTSGSYSASGIPSNTPYYFFVRAWDGGSAGAGNLSNQASQQWQVVSMAINQPSSVSKQQYALGSVLGLYQNGLAVIAGGYNANSSVNGNNVYRCTDRSCGSATATPNYQPGENPSIAIDSTSNNIFISSYVTGSFSHLQYAGFSNGAWTITTIDTMTNSGPYTSLVDVNGTPMIFYGGILSNCFNSPDQCSTLKVAYPVGGGGTGCLNTTAWTCKVLDGNTAATKMVNDSFNINGLSADFQSADRGPRVAYYFGSSFRLLACLDATCSSTIVTAQNKLPPASQFRYMRTNGVDHFLMANNGCSGAACWYYWRRTTTSDADNTTPFTQITSSGLPGFPNARSNYVSMAPDTNGNPVFFWGGLSYCANAACSSIGNSQVGVGPVSGGVDIAIGTDNIPRMLYDTASGNGSYFAICQKAYCAP